MITAGEVRHLRAKENKDYMDRFGNAELKEVFAILQALIVDAEMQEQRSIILHLPIKTQIKNTSYWHNVHDCVIVEAMERLNRLGQYQAVFVRIDGHSTNSLNISWAVGVQKFEETYGHNADA